MTREVAIKAIQDFIGWFKEDSLIRKALDMAIKELSQEPTVTSTDEPMTMVYPTIVCDDAISREAVIAWFCNQRCGCGCVDRKSCPILVGIRELPPVTQKSETVTEFADRCRECGAKYGKLLGQKSGRWIKSLIYENTYNCSKCGSAGYDTFKYCPNCGAKMESEE